MSHTYPREQKLKQKKDISLLFEKGKWKSCGHLRVIFLRNENFSGPKVGVSVSKRYFKKAVDRNRAKRLLREAYRLNKPLFTETFGEKCHAMFFYVSTEKPDGFSAIKEDFINLCLLVKKH